ncbi:hypothetical protein MNBD_GAMMA11-1333, partial [hydrothermal vent metagenome]
MIKRGINILKNTGLMTMIFLISACQGSYLNGLIIVDEIKPAESKIIGQHPSKYGECDYWKSV